MNDGGKGSRPRPFSVSNEEYARRWDAIFGRDQDRKKEDKEPPPEVEKEYDTERNSSK